MKKYIQFLITFLLVTASLGMSSSTFAFGFGYPRGGGTTSPGGYEDNGGKSTTSERGGSSCTIYRPASLQGNHAIILWGNGTGSSPSSYASLLRHWASWGFVVAAANTSNAGSGSEMLSCLDWLQSSSMANQLDFSNVGTSGHSQGGGGSIMAGTDPRIQTTAPMQPYTRGLGYRSSAARGQQGPMLLLSGGSDTIASPSRNQANVYRDASTPVFWATLNGASHFEPSGNGGDYRGISTAWFLYQLNGDTEAAENFEGSNCSYCNSSAWSVQRKGF